MENAYLARTLPLLLQRSAPKIAGILVGVAILTLSARIQVPFWPVPMTLQTMAVLVIGAAGGARVAAATVLAYLMAGLLGAPVFAGGAGPVYMAGPTGGYLLGFLSAATAVGYFADRRAGGSILTILLALLVGEALIVLPGVLWLANSIGFDRAVDAGLIPFLPAEALKVATAAALWLATVRLQRQRQHDGELS